ncbi:MAG: winged helix DNA-binding protein [Acetobacter aceti]|uniref:Transcriptional regulator n=1 Tax=Acetobacter aceti TaxID=435 RepID=A0A1U9KJ98_ACEAC|nr:winged helix DNA-binding protein [Acetobacter aceti]AQS85818.1 transcriptional regulator [Acetobacter aceti]
MKATVGTKTRRQDQRPFIVSSSHLATPGSEDLSEFEFSLTVMNNAFQHWIVRCMTAAGLPELSALETLLLHHINHRSKEKSIPSLMFALNISERHYLNYAMKKLDERGLIERRKQGKEVFVWTSAKGVAYCEEYARLRNVCLLELVPDDHCVGGITIAEVAKALRIINGFYEQASRSVSSL